MHKIEVLTAKNGFFTVKNLKTFKGCGSRRCYFLAKSTNAGSCPGDPQISPCGADFRAGEKYIVFLRNGEEPRIESGDCAGNQIFKRNGQRSAAAKHAVHNSEC